MGRGSASGRQQPIVTPAAPTMIGAMGTMQPTELVADLLGRVAAGDRAAFEDLYNAVRSRVFGLSLRLVRDWQQAEEIAQEVFLQIWRQAARFDPARGAGTPWILGIAHARAVDRIRSSRASQARDHVFYACSHVADTDTVVESVLLGLEQTAVRGALDGLSALQRESIVLAYYLGLSTSEISERLAIPVPTVKTRIRDGLIRLGKDARPLASR